MNFVALQSENLVYIFMSFFKPQSKAQDLSISCHSYGRIFKGMSSTCVYDYTEREWVSPGSKERNKQFRDSAVEIFSHIHLTSFFFSSKPSGLLIEVIHIFKKNIKTVM